MNAPEAARGAPQRSRRLLLLGVSFIIAGLAAYGASEHPDTLEHFLHGAGVEEEPSAIPAPLPDYRVEGVGSEGLSTFLAGAAGALATFGLLSLLVGFSARRRSGHSGSEPRAS